MTEFVTQDHLGGYIVGGDEATFFPELWTWLVEDYGVQSVIDVGCGEGHALKFLADLGCEATGVDGVEQPDQSIIAHDYTTGRLNLGDLDCDFDLCWSCEFVEHVEERFVPNFLSTFACADLVLMTHAWPEQPGWHHVNCRTDDYWKGTMAAIGYEFDQVLTATTRELSSENRSPWNHYLRSGLAFRRYE